MKICGLCKFYSNPSFSIDKGVCKNPSPMCDTSFRIPHSVNFLDVADRCECFIWKTSEEIALSNL